MASQRSDTVKGVGVGVGDGVGDGDGDGDVEEIGVGLDSDFAGVAGTLTPLFQTNFLPDFMQVYLIPDEIEVKPTFLQINPGLTALHELVAGRIKIATNAKNSDFFT